MTVGDEVEVRSTNANITLFFNKFRSSSFSCRPSIPPPLSPLLSDPPLCCLTDLLQEQWWGTIWLVARLDQNDDWRGNPVADADWKKIFHGTRQYLKSCFSYVFLSGVWLNMRPEAKSLSCPSPSGPLIQTDSALWKHSCGATAQKNKTSGCRLVLGKHMSHGCVNTLLSVTCDPSDPLPDPCRYRSIAAKRQWRKTSSVWLTQAISQLEGLVLNRRGSM